jgi:pimeloyl-ACP methyl ester carboxylesterase
MSVRWMGALSVALVTGGALAGCSTLLAVRGQQKRADQNAVISGTVTTDHEPRGPLIVGLATRRDSEFSVVDYFVAEKPGPWIFAVAPGTYWIGAFEDADRDTRYDDEPGLRADPDHPLQLAPGQHLRDVSLRIPRDGRLSRGPFSLAEIQAARSAGEQEVVSAFALSVAGDVTTLDDPRFDREIASKGMWQPYDFLLQGRPGIYLLEPYDPKKIPVLFVHGIGGTPQEFRTLIAALDHERFQPWVFYYGSGARLEFAATLLTQLFVRLRTSLGVERAAVVAHSMGGLVSREFILRDFETNGTDVVRTYVTISSPLGGMASAGKGVERSPVVIRAWYGLAPEGAYLNGLFFKDAARRERRRLPEHVAYHLLFGFHGGGPEGSGDGVVAVSSQLRPEAQEEARSERGFDEDHTSILRSPDVAARLTAILAELR